MGQRFPFSLFGSGSGSSASRDASNKIHKAIGLVSNTPFVVYGNGTELGRATVDILGNATVTLATAPGAGVVITYGQVFPGGTIPAPVPGVGTIGAIATPAAFQVVQRNAATTGNIPIGGTYTGSPSVIEARLNGGAWATIALSPTGGTFSGTLTGQAVGRGLLEVRADGGAATSVASVGVGDVFLLIGQSNNSGRGTNNQIYTPAGAGASLFTNAGTWTTLADPTDSATGQLDSVSGDGTLAAGSVWPLVASQILAASGTVPVGFVPAAKGGSAISAWAPPANRVDRTTLYGSANFHAKQAGGVRAALWWQGETDAQNSVSTATYQAALTSLAAAIKADLGVNLVPAKFQNCTAIPAGQQSAINTAIGNLWTGNANVTAGPDLSGIATDSGDGLHLNADAKLLSAAQLWTPVVQGIMGAAFGAPVAPVAQALAFGSAATTTGTGNAISVSRTLTIASDDNLLIVPLMMTVPANGGVDFPSATSVSVGGTALTKLDQVQSTNAGGVNRKVELWYLQNPPTGEQTITALTPQGGGQAPPTTTISAISFKNALSSPFGTVSKFGSSAGATSASVTTSDAGPSVTLAIGCARSTAALTPNGSPAPTTIYAGNGGSLAGLATRVAAAAGVNVTSSYAMSTAADAAVLMAVPIRSA